MVQEAALGDPGPRGDGLTKAQIIVLGQRLGVDYALTHSCYDPVGDLACGRCDACALRKKGFAEAGVPDPTRYAVYTSGG